LNEVAVVRVNDLFRDLRGAKPQKKAVDGFL
jgi:hypothetical protein